MFYVLRKDSDGQEFSSVCIPFENEKEAHQYCCSQCCAFPLSTFVVVQFVKEFRATVTPPSY